MDGVKRNEADHCENDALSLNVLFSQCNAAQTSFDSWPASANKLASVATYFQAPQFILICTCIKICWEGALT